MISKKTQGISDVVKFELDNGLQVNFIQKKGFSQKYAGLSVNFGSIDNQLIFEDNSKMEIPDGTAHFLEHKMFANDGYDSFEKFTKFGLEANAFTSYTQTTYYFSGTTNFEDGLKELVHMTLVPYFTEESVLKEQGIIGQEIDMYGDMPGQKVMNGLLNRLYPGSSLAKDIAGTRESISKITAEMLYKIHEAIYQPSQMSLVIVGDFNVDEIKALVKNEFDKYEYLLLDYTKGDLKLMPVKTPDEGVYTGTVDKFMLGMRVANDVSQTSNNGKIDLILSIALDMLFGESSIAYQEYYNEGIIDDSFSFGVSASRGFTFLIFTQNILKHTNIELMVKDILMNFDNNSDFTSEKFIKIRNGYISNIAFRINSISEIGQDYSNFIIDELSLIEEIDFLNKLTFEQVEKALKVSLDWENETNYTLRKTHG